MPQPNGPDGIPVFSVQKGESREKSKQPEEKTMVVKKVDKKTNQKIQKK